MKDDKNLSHKTHLRIKNFLRGVFTWAIQDDVYSEVNPMEETKAGGRVKGEPILIGPSENEKIRNRKSTNQTITHTTWKKLQK